MSIRLDKEWIAVSEAMRRLKGNMGVFQLADSNKEIIYIGFAGAKSHFGLKGEVLKSVGASLLQSADGEVITEWQAAKDTDPPTDLAENTASVEEEKLASWTVEGNLSLPPGLASLGFGS